MSARHIFASQIPESVAEAYDGVQSLVAPDGSASLEELQGAVEYLLDTLKAAQPALHNHQHRLNKAP
jgi:hypothetical protein